MKFQDNLKIARTKANLSQEELAERMSVSRQTISKWENGDTYPSTKHIFMLAEALNCNVNQLIDNEQNSNLFLQKWRRLLVQVPIFGRPWLSSGGCIIYEIS